ncbi:hypothetical protein KJ575_00915 [Patescibacteria group bacterium]|nr:hypothetical protein [Patescibacteria group bacterium]
MQTELLVLVIVGSILGILVLTYFFAKAVKITKPVKRLGELPQPAQPQPAQLSEASGVSASIITGIIVLVIILAVLWPFFGPVDKTYDAEEFKNLGCNVNGSSLVLDGNGCQLNGTEKMSIAKVVIIPESLPTGAEIWTSVGPYQFKYFSYSVKKGEDYYKGDVYQQGWNGPITYAPDKHGKPSDEPLPIMIMVNGWYRIPVLGMIPAALDPNPHPVLLIKSRLFYESLAQGQRLDNDPPVQGLVAIKSGEQIVRIKEVKIYYGSLLRTISHLIFG